MQRRHQPGPGLRKFRPGQPTVRQTCPWKVPAVRPSLITPPRLKFPALSDPEKGWNFGKAGWKRFCVVTGESVERLPPMDTTNIESAYKIFARAYYPRPSNAFHVIVTRTMCHVETKNARPSIAPSFEPQWGLTLIQLRPYFFGCNRKNRRDGRKLSIPSTSRTLAARRGEPPTSSLAGLRPDAPLACAPSRKTPSPRNLRRTGHIGLGAASPPVLSTRSCPTYGKSQNLGVTVSLTLLGKRSLLPPSGV